MFALIATIAVVHLLALASPGPDFLFVTRTAVSQSRGKAMLGVLGITAGVAFWAGLSILGLQVLSRSCPGCRARSPLPAAFISFGWAGSSSKAP